MRPAAPAQPLTLTARGLDAARRALAEPERRRAGARRVLLCATLMAAAALALCAVVVLSGEPAPQTPATPVRELLTPLPAGEGGARRAAEGG